MTTSRAGAEAGVGVTFDGAGAAGATLATRLGGVAGLDTAPGGCAHTVPVAPATTVAAATQPLRNLVLTSSPALFVGPRGLNHLASDFNNVKLKKERLTMRKWHASVHCGLLTVALLRTSRACPRGPRAAIACFRAGRGGRPAARLNASAPGYEPYHAVPERVLRQGMIERGTPGCELLGERAAANNTDCSLADQFEITPRCNEPSLTSSTSDAVSGGQRSDPLLVQPATLTET